MLHDALHRLTTTTTTTSRAALALARRPRASSPSTAPRDGRRSLASAFVDRDATRRHDDGRRPLATASAAANVFDRDAKRRQRSRAALAVDARDYDYLRSEVAARLADRILVSVGVGRVRF